jgi:hypothetical protein
MHTNLTFYNTNDLNATLLALLIKGRKQDLTFNVFCSHEFLQNFSRLLWNSSYPLIHGIIDDGFYKMQPIIICSKEEYFLQNTNSDIKKDCLILVECDEYVEISNWNKVLLVNCRVLNEYKNYPFETWEYNKEENKQGVWKKL